MKTYHNVEALPGVLGNRGKKGIYFRGTGEQSPTFEGNGEQRQYGEEGTQENTFSMFVEQGNKPIFFRGTSGQVALIF